MAISCICLGKGIEGVEAMVDHQGDRFRLVVSGYFLRMRYGAGETSAALIDAFKAAVRDIERVALGRFEKSPGSLVVLYKAED